MSRKHPRRARFGVEALERRDLAAIYMQIEGIKGNVTAGTQSAEVQPLDLNDPGGAGQDDAAGSRDMVLKGQKILQN